MCESESVRACLYVRSVSACAHVYVWVRVYLRVCLSLSRLLCHGMGSDVISEHDLAAFAGALIHEVSLNCQ